MYVTGEIFHLVGIDSLVSCREQARAVFSSFKNSKDNYIYVTKTVKLNRLIASTLIFSRARLRPIQYKKSGKKGFI